MILIEMKVPPKPRIAVPVPTSFDPSYNKKSWPDYSHAVIQSGGEAVQIPLDLSPDRVATLANSCHAVLLPGSPADVNPHRYGQEPAKETAPPDHLRENVDELLLQDAHNLHKPILGICFGCQNLNVWRGGTLLQDLSTLVVDHRAGAAVSIAHAVAIHPDSHLAYLLGSTRTPLFREASDFAEPSPLPVNSSHHQALGIVGDGLHVVARCPQDQIAEAIEGISAGSLTTSCTQHFVLGLQWHPERSFDLSPASRAIFGAFVTAAAAWVPRRVLASVV